MAYERLQAVVGTALIDSGFRRSLLARSFGVLAEFDLSSEEVAAVMSVEADTLQEFASQLHQWMVRETASHILRSRPMAFPVAVMA
ncbi:MAG: hypothetical protein JXA74_07370 [Anaerolineae bacterium]|nr:hypothetical protein [Anaerolineae bacterium]